MDRVCARCTVRRVLSVGSAPLTASPRRGTGFVLRPKSQQIATVPPRTRCFSSRSNLRFTQSIVARQQHAKTTDEPTFLHLDTFPRRHIGPATSEVDGMLQTLDPPCSSLDDFVSQALPPGILSDRKIHIEGPANKRGQHTRDSIEQGGYTESELLKRLHEIASQNKVYRSYIGCGYAGTRVPEVIKRNVLENPGWYTSYTPYQPEISQGRLQSLLNFQTLVTDLTAMNIANASALDEPTAAAEAMTLSINALDSKKAKRPNKTFLVSDLCHPQTCAVLRSRADGFGIKIVTGDVLADDCALVKEIGDDLIGVMVQYPDTEGGVSDFSSLAKLVHDLGGTVNVGTDLLALTVLKPPGEWGADVAFGNAQRLGVPLGYGGPHAAFFACNEKHRRKIPGRLVGMSKDRLGDPAARLALQTREQHIRREKATSNICTAQALLANMSAMYAVYHGPDGLKRIAQHCMDAAGVVEQGVQQLGFKTGSRGHGDLFFDTVVVHVENASELLNKAASELHINFRQLDEKRVAITLDETVDENDVELILEVFEKYGGGKGSSAESKAVSKRGQANFAIPDNFKRTSEYLTHPVFNTHHSETELLRYMHLLQSKDLSLTHSMIPLGSCTMKLNPTTSMVPISWPEFASLHPFAPVDQAQGYMTLIKELENDLADITGFDAISLQPNSGAQGEFTGLRLIRKFHEENGSHKRDICLIPVSAHGTNPASAAMCGMRVVTIKCDPKTGNLDMADLKAKCEKHSHELAAIMITYPSTFGVFEPGIKDTCNIVHEHGGQVYMDGANMNAQIGLCSPGELGADVCHLNLHKTFCIPHGGGGPGVGPIGVAKHLTPFLPGHPLIKTGGEKATYPVSGAPWGSASILPISWAYIKLMGAAGLQYGTKMALLNANYLLSRLRPHYPIMYTNDKGRCAHEFILDTRGFKATAGIEAIDIAKRLQDYGFHAPTMSWPVANTLMIEPTESESKEELDRFADALIGIREEIREIEDGKMPKEGNVMKMAPHSVKDLVREEWGRCYTREKAAYPRRWLREKKFWPSVTRLDDAYGDMNLFCTCAPVEDSEDITGAAAPAPT